jgi:hypothetical protein
MLHQFYSFRITQPSTGSKSNWVTTDDIAAESLNFVIDLPNERIYFEDRAGWSLQRYLNKNYSQYKLIAEDHTFEVNLPD